MRACSCGSKEFTLRGSFEPSVTLDEWGVARPDAGQVFVPEWAACKRCGMIHEVELLASTTMSMDVVVGREEP